jgi:hypothetical protein
LDGSLKPWFPLGLLPGTSNITYHHLPPMIGENWLENYSRRMNFAANLPATPVSALCSDEDFFTISGLKLAISVILNSLEVDAVVGVCAQYKYSDSALLWNLRYANWQEGLKSRSYSVSDRALDQSGAFYLYWSLIRTDIWRNVLRHTFMFYHSHSSLHEHLFNQIAKASCKVEVKQHTLWIKKVWELNPGTFRQVSKDQDTDWFRDRKNRKDVQFVTKHLATGIASAISNSNSSVSAEVLAKRYFRSFSKFSNTAKFKKYNKKIMRKVVLKLTFLPDFIKKSFNSLLPKRLRVLTGSVPLTQNRHLTKDNFFVLTSLFPELSKTDIGFVEKDFTMIEKLLLMPREELRLRADI